MRYRPSPPYEWTCHVVASNYNTTPHQAHIELGGGPLSRRQRRRLTWAASDLAGLMASFEGVDRKRGPKDPPADAEHMLRVKEARTLYEEAETADRLAFNAAVEEGALRLAKLGITADDPIPEPA